MQMSAPKLGESALTLAASTFALAFTFAFPAMVSQCFGKQTPGTLVAEI